MKTSFSGHEKFDCKASWLSLAYCNTDIIQGDIETAMALTGIGSNKVKSLRQWIQKFGLLDKGQFNELASLVFAKDPYLEKIDSIWILHAFLTQNVEKATLYYLFFNQFFFTTFTKDSLQSKLEKWCSDHEITMSTSTLESDIAVLTRMYLKNENKDQFSASLFHDLNILHKVDNEYIVNVKNPAVLSDEAFVFIFCYFIRKHEGNTISVKDLQFGQSSLQHTLCMTEEKLLEKL
ncbi:MAG: DUF4007 family protein, partial [Sulfurovum sp.]|nr:DUF4007 family protein [Sulfurovum sp.]